MDINAKGNLGTGNSFTEIRIEKGAIYNNLPNATQVTNITNIHGDGNSAPARGAEMDDKEKQILKNAILEFAGKLKENTAPDWTDKYDRLWVSILALPEVDAQVYDKGRLHNTLFNRALIGGIVRVMLDKGIFARTASPTTLAPLVGIGNESFRKEMGLYPSKEIRTAVAGLIEKQQEWQKKSR